MFGHVKCEFASEKCSKEWVATWLVVCLAVISCALPLIYPFCKSIGIQTTPEMYMGVQPTIETAIIFVIWVPSYEAIDVRYEYSTFAAMPIVVIVKANRDATIGTVGTMTISREPCALIKELKGVHIYVVSDVPFRGIYSNPEPQYFTVSAATIGLSYPHG